MKISELISWRENETKQISHIFRNVYLMILMYTTYILWLQLSWVFPVSIYHEMNLRKNMNNYSDRAAVQVHEYTQIYWKYTGKGKLEHNMTPHWTPAKWKFKYTHAVIRKTVVMRHSWNELTQWERRSKN